MWLNVRASESWGPTQAWALLAQGPGATHSTSLRMLHHLRNGETMKRR